MVSNTDCSSPGDLEMTFSTSELAVCCCSAAASCSRASANSRVRMLTCSCRVASVDVAGGALLAALLRFGLVGFRRCELADLRRRALAVLLLALERRRIAHPKAQDYADTD